MMFQADAVISFLKDCRDCTKSSDNLLCALVHAQSISNLLTLW